MRKCPVTPLRCRPMRRLRRVIVRQWPRARFRHAAIASTAVVRTAEEIPSGPRGVHLLAYLKHEELTQTDRPQDFESAAQDARTVQHEALGSDDESVESWTSDATERPFSPTVSSAHRSFGDNP